jgi:HEAT repeat protein
MRSVWLSAAALLLAGCGAAQPTMVHGKPVSHWLEALRSPEAGVRKKAVHALGFVGASDPAALSALTGAVKDRDAGVRAEAVLALLNLGPAARDALPALEEAQKDRDARVRAYAAKALERVKGG